MSCGQGPLGAAGDSERGSGASAVVSWGTSVFCAEPWVEVEGTVVEEEAAA